ncbi:putative glycolipid-binding domain-containing protein [Pseudomonas sp. GCM10022186]|uniref:putative glycolipid-binding domain-containing protein n=1 Tax=Pseudomonas sp. GCM10022186 TaxID=3252650 RepID=UPI00360C3AA5
MLDSDPRWRFRHLWLKVENHGQSSLRLDRDIRGRWLLNGQHRRGLDTGQREQLQIAYIDLPSLRVEARQSRYHCLRQQAQELCQRMSGGR